MLLENDATVDYYDQNAADFCSRTVAVDMERAYIAFLRLLSRGAGILDAGCGSGRDSEHFLGQGYRVTAFDASEELAILAEQHTGQQVRRLRFQDLDYEGEFDGIWANASLLHVPRCEMHDVLRRLVRALRVGGVIYMSFKKGEGEREAHGRWFNYYTCDSLRDALAHHSGVEVIELWESADRRPGRSHELWVNALARRVAQD